MYRRTNHRSLGDGDLEHKIVQKALEAIEEGITRQRGLSREEYFPDIEDLHIKDRDAFAGGLVSDDKTYIIVLSRGFSRDKAFLGQLLKKEFRCIGMIGSHRKMENIIKGLQEEGLPEEAFSVLKSPIGLDIGAETPEEIAVSIAGEMIAVKKGKFTLPDYHNRKEKESWKKNQKVSKNY